MREGQLVLVEGRGERVGVLWVNGFRKGMIMEESEERTVCNEIGQRLHVFVVRNVGLL